MLSWRVLPTIAEVGLIYTLPAIYSLVWKLQFILAMSEILYKWVFQVAAQMA